MNQKRIVVLDTETTGINKSNFPYINHRIIEIGAVEIINRRFTGNNFHKYVQPNRSIEHDAFKIHKITDDFLLDKPLFKDIADDFLYYIKNSQLVIHNASFDLGFINQELMMLNKKIKKVDTLCSIVDTLKIARKLFPGKKNTLDALCKRYKINKSYRDVHSAIIDSFLLGKLYLLMTGGQEQMFVCDTINDKKLIQKSKNFIRTVHSPLKVIKSTEKEKSLHEQYLQYMKKNNICLWK
ncbi:DNA polymerase III subunit epsilon [Buchnera aphidicola]|uniref:DNA polymerase III subunit epsilon n=1 Tax=Buchnera aphidicola (Artemisaphis artemisicola) TaxID=1241836 RepID=A0A4D6XQX6_9GAMM|nr:DNA polymerase III subunit epsilon [Buchnera aphidicola]QCI16251.1 DNA polymerase III subunit epsilon [Buchnera aphidicola (Artemisaphis artemisicola)]